MSDVALKKTRYTQAENYLFEAIKLLRDTDGYPHADSMIRSDLSWLAIKQGKFERATVLAQEALQIAADHNYIHKASAALDKLQWIPFLAKDYARAAETAQTVYASPKIVQLALATSCLRLLDGQSNRLWTGTL